METFELDIPQVKSAVVALGDSALDQKKNKSAEKVTNLFEEEEKIVHMTVVLKKIPSHTTRVTNIRVRLPHPYRDPTTTSVCLFVKDLSKDKWNFEIDKDAKVFKEELIAERGVTNIAEIISLRQLKREYKTYEAKRKLSSAFDVFVSDHRILPLVIRNLGKSFFERNKLPLTVKIEGNVQQRIREVLATATFTVKPTGVRISAVVGSLSQPRADLLENIRSSFEALRKALPGGPVNIRSVYLASGKGPVQLPIYVSLLSANFVTLPSSRPTGQADLTDELSTLDPELFGDDITQVKVKRGGRVSLVTKDGREVIEGKKAKKIKRLGGKPLALGGKKQKLKLTKKESPTGATAAC